jgi:hypothetical protein
MRSNSVKQKKLGLEEHKKDILCERKEQRFCYLHKGMFAWSP